MWFSSFLVIVVGLVDADLLGDPIRLRQILGMAKLAQPVCDLRFKADGDGLARGGARLAACAFACASSGWFLIGIHILDIFAETILKPSFLSAMARYSLI